MSDYLTEQIAGIRGDIRSLRRDRATYRDVVVVAVDTEASQITVATPGAEPVAGVDWPPHFLPEVGDTVRVQLQGATVLYTPGSIAENAITERELSQTVVDSIETTLATANGKNKVTYSTAVPPAGPPAPGTTIGDIWFRRSGSTIIGTWELDASGWQSRTFGDQTIGTLTAGKITTGTLAAGVNVDVGDANGGIARMAGGVGFVYLAPDPVDGVPNEVLRLGQTSGGTNPATGEKTWNIDEYGNPSFNNGSFNSLRVGGTDIADLIKDEDNGIQVWYPNGKLQGNIALEFGVLEAYRRLDRNRNYVVTVSICLLSTENNGEARVAVRHTTDGSRPTTSSPLLAERFYTLPVGGRWNDQEFSFIFQRDGDDPQDVKFLITLTRGTGQTVGTVATAGNPPTIRVDDRGPYTMPSGTAANNGSVGGSSTPAPTRRVDTVWGVWAQNFRGTDGSVRTDTTDLVQGLDPSGFNGDGRSLVGFGDLTSMLSGATIESIHLYLYNYRWYHNSGGQAIIGTHGYTTAPSTFGAPNVARIRVGWGEAEGRWVDITGWAAEFANGTTKGITLGPSNSGNLVYYGRFLGVSDQAHPDLRPRLQIVYYK